MRLLSVTFLAFAALLAAPIVSAADIGQVKVTSGAVHIERGAERLPVTVGARVRVSDTVVTGGDGSVGITFTDNTLLSAGPNSALVLERYVFDSTTHAGKFDARLNRGSLAIVSGKIAKQSPDAMVVKTPSSLLGVRGTEFLVKVESTE
ncbi:MAG: FecR family protein [Betaproteobacteria bacterium]|nr:FecR family protein [Betaproteobacteria bacterium]MDH3439017.1 FecR family protein [Betaproteobacteria bacterium]